MKRNIERILAVVLLSAVCLSFAACSADVGTNGGSDLVSAITSINRDEPLADATESPDSGAEGATVLAEKTPDAVEDGMGDADDVNEDIKDEPSIASDEPLIDDMPESEQEPEREEAEPAPDNEELAQPEDDAPPGDEDEIAQNAQDSDNGPPDDADVVASSIESQGALNNPADADDIVYITKTGKRYHVLNPCGSGTYYESTLGDALAKGLTPCQKCVGD